MNFSPIVPEKDDLIYKLVINDSKNVVQKVLQKRPGVVEHDSYQPPTFN